MKAVLVSKNRHKARELRQVLTDWEIETIDAVELPEERGETFYENARAKARFGRKAVDPAAWVLGEDSGLEVDDLGGRPGIYSARYGGPGATDEANVRKLLAELRGNEAAPRRARYVCELVAVAPDGDEISARGTLVGRIAEEARGSGGFGYDPVFIPEGESETVAELGDDWKTANSHRARAARALADALRTAARAL
jgi:non-canonical purine NTP pyrophosphatase (RdgB/HAM1 family)